MNLTQRALLFDGGNRLPKTSLLLYLGRPNLEAADVPLGDDTEIGDDTIIRWMFLLPADADIRAATGWVSGVGNIFYDAIGDPVAVLASEIAAWSSINQWNVLFHLVSADTETGRLAIYDPYTTSLATISKAYKALRETQDGTVIAHTTPFTDAIGANIRTLYGLQYLHLAGATDFTNASITGTETVTSQPSGTAVITVAARKLAVGAGDLWSFALSNGSTYEFGTILTATTGVVFDTSGNGQHLLFTVDDTSLVCIGGSREKGSDWLDMEGWTPSGESFLVEVDEELGTGLYLADGGIVPALSDSSGCCAFMSNFELLPIGTIPHIDVAGFWKVNNGMVELSRGPEILFASGDASTWMTTAIWGFEYTTSTAAIDIALGGGVLFSGTTPINRTWFDWMIHPLMNENYIFIGRNGIVAYSSDNSSSLSQIGEYLNSSIVYTLGTEKVINGGFDTDTGWYKNADWTIHDGKAYVSGSITGNIYRNASLDITKIYRAEFTVSEMSGTNNGVGLSPNSTTIPNIRKNPGTFKENFTPSTKNIYFRGAYGQLAALDNLSVKEIIPL